MPWLVVVAALVLPVAAKWCNTGDQHKCRGTWNSWDDSWYTPQGADFVPETWQSFAIPVDWNGNGRADLLITETVVQNGDWLSVPTWNATVQLYLRQTNGSLQRVSGHDTPDGLQVVAGFVEVADWDGDGLPELLVCRPADADEAATGATAVLQLVRRDGEVAETLLRFHGEKAFGCQMPRAVDWDGDGDLDLLLGTAGGRLRFFERISDGLGLGGLRERHGAQSPLESTNVLLAALGSEPQWATPEAADWDGDGDIDLIVAAAEQTLFMERLGDGSLQYRSGDGNPFEEFSKSLAPIIRRLVAVDWDGDGNLDIFESVRGGRAKCDNFYFHQRHSHWQGVEIPSSEGPHASIGQPTNVAALQVLDWNGDGMLDLLLVRYGSFDVYLRRATGELVLFGPVSVPVGDSGYWAATEQLAHWDGDGLWDVAFCTESFPGAMLSVHLGLPNGTVATEPALLVPQIDGLSCDNFEVTDWDGDGLPDFLFRNGVLLRQAGGGKSGVAEEAGGGKSGGPKDVSFEMVRLLPPLPWGSFAKSADWDGDGLRDLCVLFYGDDGAQGKPAELWVHQRLVNGSLEAARKVPLPRQRPADDNRPSALEIVDWDGDGHLEVMAVDIQGDRMTYLYVHLWSASCMPRSTCNGHGLCGGATSECSCSAGYNGSSGDCSACDEGFFSARGAEAAGGRHCQRCAGYAPGHGSCHSRGTCFDDSRAHEWAASELDRLVAAGNGSCTCDDPAFSGDGCGVGECPAGLQELGGVCVLDVGQLCMCVLLGSMLILVGLLLPLLIGWHVAVQDISREDGRVVVTTVRPHFLLQRPPIRTLLRLEGTGHFLADGRGRPFQARPLDMYRLELLESAGCPCEQRIDSSMGTLRVARCRAPWVLGVCRVPCGVWASLLVVVASLTVTLGELPASSASVATAVGLLLGVAVALWRRWSTASALSKRLREFRHRLQSQREKGGAFAGVAAVERTPRGPQRALPLEQLQSFFEWFEAFLRDRNMYYVCSNLVKPLTRAERVSYAELAGPAEVRWFVSHFWGHPFRLFLETLRAHSRHVTSTAAEAAMQAYWVCTFANNQWAVEEELGGGECEQSSFYLALSSPGCGSTVLVLDEEVQPLRRSWCLFEVVHTLQQSGGGSLHLCAASGLLGQGGAVDVALAVAKSLAKLKLEDAQATSQEDKAAIDARVEAMDGGFPAANAKVRNKMREALQATQGFFQTEVQGLLSELDLGDGGSSLGDGASPSTVAEPGDGTGLSAPKAAAQRPSLPAAAASPEAAAHRSMAEAPCNPVLLGSERRFPPLAAASKEPEVAPPNSARS